jgi:hypothetical protein
MQHFQPALDGHQRGGVVPRRLGDGVHGWPREAWISCTMDTKAGPISRSLRARPMSIPGPRQLMDRGGCPFSRRGVATIVMGWPDSASATQKPLVRTFPMAALERPRNCLHSRP